MIKELGLSGIANTVQVPKEYVLLNRMVTLLLGICSTLDSKMNPIEIVQPYLQKYMLGEEGNAVQFITNLIKGNLTTIISLPSEVQKTMKLVQKGELEWNVAQQSTQNRLFYTLGQQFILAILLIASTSFTYLFYQQQHEDMTYYGLGISGIIAFLLIRSMWRHRLR